MWNIYMNITDLKSSALRRSNVPDKSGAPEPEPGLEKEGDGE
jgi:hypothetical protein